MQKHVRRLSAAILILAFSTVTQADVIVNANSTTDTAQGLEFLHVNQSSFMNYVSAQAGISYDGFTWELATVDQFLQLMEGATGVSIPDWDGSNLDDVNFDSTQADAMMAALGEGASSEIEGFWVDGGSYGEAQIYAHTSCCDDFHVDNGSWRDPAPALFVRAAGPAAPIAPIPTLTLWGGILMAILMFGLASMYFSRRINI